VAAIDGSKFKAVNTPRQELHPRLDPAADGASGGQHHALSVRALETADRQEGELAQAKAVRLKEKIASLREQMKDFKDLEIQVHAAPDKQISLTDPDARAMATTGKGTGMVGYNVQTAVDTKHHLIVAHEVTNVATDRGQLANMAGQAKDAMGVEALEVLADRGYFSGEEILACGPLGVTPILPTAVDLRRQGRWPVRQAGLRLSARKERLPLPAGQLLPHHMTTIERGLTLHPVLGCASCSACALKSRCTTSLERRITRWEHEAVIEAMPGAAGSGPKAMRIRRATAEHPFGTLKAWMGATHFKIKTLERVTTEMSLHVLAYNLKR